MKKIKNLLVIGIVSLLLASIVFSADSNNRQSFYLKCVAATSNVANAVYVTAATWIQATAGTWSWNTGSNWYTNGIPTNGVNTSVTFFPSIGTYISNNITIVNDPAPIYVTTNFIYQQEQITFTNYNKTEILTNFPALVIFTQNQYSSFISTNGFDLRFWSGTPYASSNLNYEIDNWNINTNSYVWVQIPLLTSNTTIYATWGDSLNSSQQAYTTNGATWSNGFAAVWHMNQTNVVDSTLHIANGTSSNNTNTVGMADGAQGFNGSNAYIRTPTFSLPSPLTVEAWTYALSLADLNSAGSLVQKSPVNAEWSLFFKSGVLKWRGVGTTLDVNYTMPSAGWHHCVGQAVGTNASLYVDGSLKTTGPSTAIPNGSGTIQLGTIDSGQYTYWLKGIEDEVRISTVARSSNWLWATYQNIASNSAFQPYSSIQSTNTVIPYLVTNFIANSLTFNGTTVQNYSMPITFNGYSRNVTLTNFPVLVIMTNIFGFNSTNGYDLIFTDNTQTNILNYEIDTFTSTNGLIWVQVPYLTSNTVIYANWGGTNLPIQQVYTTNGSTWSANYGAVWHLGTTKDSSTNQVALTFTSSSITSGGLIDGCASITGTTPYVSSPASITNFPLTMSVWYKFNATNWANNTGPIFISAYDPSSLNEFWIDFYMGSGVNQLRNIAQHSGTYGGIYNATPDTNIWHLITSIFPSAGTSQLFIDGKLVTFTSASGSVTPTGISKFAIGGFIYNGSTWYDVPFNGLEDEARFSSIARSTNWVWAEYQNMASNNLFQSYGQVSIIASSTTITIGSTTNSWTLSGITPSINCNTLDYSSNICNIVFNPLINLGANTTINSNGNANFYFGGLSGNYTLTKTGTCSSVFNNVTISNLVLNQGIFGSSTLLSLGDIPNPVGNVTLNNGTLIVTNNGNAQMVVGKTGLGTLNLSGGNMIVDQLIVTNNNRTLQTTNSIINFNVTNGTVSILNGMTIYPVSNTEFNIRGTWSILGGNSIIQNYNAFVPVLTVGNNVTPGDKLVVSGSNTILTLNGSGGSQEAMDITPSCSLIVSNGAKLVNNLTSAMNMSDSSLCLVNSAIMSVAQGIYIGDNYHNGSGKDNSSLVVTNKSCLVAAGVEVGYYGLGFADNTNNSLIISDNSVCTNTAHFAVGESAASNGQAKNNRLVISGNSTLYSTSSQNIIGSGHNGDGGAGAGYTNQNNYAVVTGTGSLWYITKNLTVGDAPNLSPSWSSGNSLIISNGGTVVAGSLIISSTGANIGVATNNGILIDNGYLYVTNTSPLQVGAIGQGYITVQNGGLLEVNNSITNGGSGSYVTNNNSTFQFASGTPTIYPNGFGNIAISNGIISFRGITNADILCNKSGKPLDPTNKIAYFGNNTFELNSATNIITNQVYSFSTGSSTNWTNLILANGSQYRGGSITFGSGGSLIVQGLSNSVVTNVSFTVGSTNQFIISSTNNYGNMNVVTGAVNLTNSILNINDAGFIGTTGQVFTLWHPISPGAIVGTYSNLPQGTLISTYTNRYIISYNGGINSNDIILTVANIATNFTLVAPLLSGNATINSLTTLNGNIYAGTYPNGNLLQWNGSNAWTSVAPLYASESSISPILTYSGTVYGCSYANGNLLQWNGSNAWTSVAPKYVGSLHSDQSMDSMIIYSNLIFASGSQTHELLQWNGSNAWVSRALDAGYGQMYSLAIFNNQLYAGTGNGSLLKWNGSNALTQVAVPYLSQSRIYCMNVFNGNLYAGTYPNGYLFQWNGSNAWTNTVTTQYGGEYPSVGAMTALNNQLYVGTSGGLLLRWDGISSTWFLTCSKYASEAPINCLTIFNGYIYAGTSPNGNLLWAH